MHPTYFTVDVFCFSASNFIEIPIVLLHGIESEHWFWTSLVFILLKFFGSSRDLVDKIVGRTPCTIGTLYFFKLQKKNSGYLNGLEKRPIFSDGAEFASYLGKDVLRYYKSICPVCEQRSCSQTGQILLVIDSKGEHHEEKRTRTLLVI